MHAAVGAPTDPCTILSYLSVRLYQHFYVLTAMLKLCCTVQYWAVLCTVLYCAVLLGTVLYCAMLNCVVLFCAVFCSEQLCAVLVAL